MNSVNFAAAVLCAAVGLSTATVRADDSTEQVRARIAAAQKKLDDLRDNATAADYQTVQGRNASGGVEVRRVPTPEFAARIQAVEDELHAAEGELKHPRRSL